MISIYVFQSMKRVVYIFRIYCTVLFHSLLTSNTIQHGLFGVKWRPYPSVTVRKDLTLDIGSELFQFTWTRFGCQLQATKHSDLSLKNSQFDFFWKPCEFPHFLSSFFERLKIINTLVFPGFQRFPVVSSWKWRIFHKKEYIHYFLVWNRLLPLVHVPRIRNGYQRIQ